MKQKIRIGTRGSSLALIQAEMVKNALRDNCNVDSELIVIKSQGDLDQDTPVTKLGAGSFTNEINQQVISGKVDVAVHSCKDLPGALQEEIDIVAVLKRASWFDVIVYKGNDHFLDDPASEALIATGSPRRRAQWRYRYPKHQFEELRGNIETRLKKLEDSKWNGIIMAEAALQRLGIKNIQTKKLISSLPSPCQGTIAIVCRKDSEWFEPLQAVNHLPTYILTTIERDFIKALPINCDTPLGVLATSNGNQFYLKAELFSASHKSRIEIEEFCYMENIYKFGKESAQRFLSIGADRYF